MSSPYSLNTARHPEQSRKNHYDGGSLENEFISQESFRMEGKTQTKFQPFGVELLACRDRIELESSDLSISSRNNCFLRDNRSCEAHGPREFAMKKAAAEEASVNKCDWTCTSGTRI